MRIHLLFIPLLAAGAGAWLWPGADLRTAPSSGYRQLSPGSAAPPSVQTPADADVRTAGITDPELLVLSAGSFDPLVDAAPGEPAIDADAPPTPYRVVQLTRSYSPVHRRMVEAAGARTVAHLPRLAWVLRIDPGAPALPLPQERWRGELPPSWRLSPELWPYAADPALAWPGEFARVLAVQSFAGSEDAARADLEALNLPAGATRISIVSDELGRVTGYFRTPPDQLGTLARRLARLPHSEWVQRYEIPVTSNEKSTLLMQGGDANRNESPIWDRGLTGTGQIVGVADSGLDTDACQFRFSADAAAQTLANNTRPPTANITNPDDKVLAYYVLPGAEAYDDAGGVFHGTHTSGNAVGDNYTTLAGPDSAGRDLHDGMAPAARLVFQDLGDHRGRLVGLVNASSGDMHRQAYETGARVHNNSFGEPFNDTRYGFESAQIDQAAWQLPDYLIVFAAGNNGPSARSLGGGGSTAKNSLVVGATMPFSYEEGDAVADFSSQGPASDGRVKPDVLAPGVVMSATEVDGNDLGCCDQFGRRRFSSRTDPPNNQCAVDERALTGTSYSAPLAAGAAALVRQYFMDGFYPTGIEIPENGFEPSSALMKAMLINGARGVSGGIASVTRGRRIADAPAPPSAVQGWGLIDLDAALAFEDDPRRLSVLNDVRSGVTEPVAPATTPAITTGATQGFEIEGVLPGAPLKVTLVWTDPFASPMGGSALVNDLDLEVVDPDGTVYRGNRNFENGFTAPDMLEVRDTTNNVEQVVIDVQVGGTYGVRVVGRQVGGNGENGAFDTTKQGYALIATGNFAQGEPRPILDLSGAGVTGGCDEDQSLERGETLTLAVSARNIGTADAKDAQATVRVSPLSDLTGEAVRIDGGEEATVDLGDLEPGDLGQAAIDLSLEIVEESLCGRELSLQILLRADDVDERSFTFTLPVDVDPSPGGADCETAPCLPPPVIDEVAPGLVERGGSIFELEVRGSGFVAGSMLRLGPDITVTETEALDETTLVARDITVALDAIPGPRNVVVLNPDDQLALAPAALNVALALDTPRGGKSSGCDCRSAAPDAGSLLWPLCALWLYFARRRR